MSAAFDRSVPADAAGGALAEAVAQAEHEKVRVAVTRNGKPVAALVPIEDVEALEAWEDEQDSAAIREGMADYGRTGQEWVTHEELLARMIGVLDPSVGTRILAAIHALAADPLRAANVRANGVP